MKALWTSEEIAQATGGKCAGAFAVHSVGIDSRLLEKGALFVALPGERVDGHQFVAEALQRGAAGALVTRVPEGADASRCVVVNDVLVALQALAKAARARTKAKIIGVTGSVGKTSAKEMLKLALSACGSTFASSGNFNNHIGLPLNLCNLPPDARYAVLEMGMNHAGEVALLTRIARPHVALITNVEAVHLEFFDSVEAIAHAKAEIFEGVEPGGAAVINADQAQMVILEEAARRCGIRNVVSFGEAHLLEYRFDGVGAALRAQVGAREYSYRLGTVGRHFAVLSTGVLAAAEAAGADVSKAAQALAGFCEVRGRGALMKIAVRGGEALLIDDSYNASPAAMKAAFAKAREIAGARGGRLIAALGEMRELGASAPQLHADLARTTDGFAQVLTAGALMQYLHEALPQGRRGVHVASARELIPHLERILQSKDILLVKGSHGSKMYEVVSALMEQGERTQHAV